MRTPLMSDRALEHFLNPRNAGTILKPTGEGWAGTVETTRFMRIQVRFSSHGHVEEAGFGTYGCAPAIACGSCITEWVTGRTVEEGMACTARALRKALGGLPSARRYCADLAVEALRAALLDASRRSASPSADAEETGESIQCPS